MNCQNGDGGGSWVGQSNFPPSETSGCKRGCKKCRGFKGYLSRKACLAEIRGELPSPRGISRDNFAGTIFRGSCLAFFLGRNRRKKSTGKFTGHNKIQIRIWEFRIPKIGKREVWGQKTPTSDRPGKGRFESKNPHFLVVPVERCGFLDSTHLFLWGDRKWELFDPERAETLFSNCGDFDFCRGSVDSQILSAPPTLLGLPHMGV